MASPLGDCSEVEVGTSGSHAGGVNPSSMVAEPMVNSTGTGAASSSTTRDARPLLDRVLAEPAVVSRLEREETQKAINALVVAVRDIQMSMTQLEARMRENVQNLSAAGRKKEDEEQRTTHTNTISNPPCSMALT